MSINCPGGTLYNVQPGDTLFGISQRFGLTMQRLLLANPQISDPERIQVGQVICIPGAAPQPCPGTPYVIAPGDTLFNLARRFGTTVQELLRVNPGIDPNRLVVGQEICVPTRVPVRRCVVLHPTDIAPAAEAAVFLNPSRILAMVTNVPRPEQLPGGEVYKIYVGRMASDDFSVTTMTEGLPGVWVADVSVPFPVPEIQSILISAEQEENVGVPQGLGVATIILGPPA